MNTLLFIGGLGMQELLVILLIVLLLFGGKKLPEMMRGLGQGVKAFKDGMNEDKPKEEAKGTEQGSANASLSPQGESEGASS